MKKLYFIRHAQSELGAANLGAGHTDTPLTELGRQQAKLAGVEAMQLKIDYIISSPLSRALDTAKIIAKEIGYPPDKIEINDLFIERDFGELEGKPMIQSIDFDYDSVKGIEKTNELLHRMKLAIDYLDTLPYEHILVVAHGQTGRAMRHHLKEVPFDMTKSSGLPNAEIVRWL